MTSTHKTRCSADGDIHQSLTEIPLHRLTLTIKNPTKSTNKQTRSVGEDVERSGHVCTVGADVQWCSWCWTWRGGCSASEKGHLHPATPLWVYTTRGGDRSQRDTRTPPYKCSQQLRRGDGSQIYVPPCTNTHGS